MNTNQSISTLSAVPGGDISHQSPQKVFDQLVIAHPHLVNSFQLALDNIDLAPDGEVVPIVGPSEVGTTLLGRRLWQHYQNTGRQGAGLMSTQPAVNAYAIGLSAPSQIGRLDMSYWKRVLTLMLQRGGDLLIDGKIYIPPGEFVLTQPVAYPDPLKMGIDTLMGAVVAMLRQRGTRVILINQADRLFPQAEKESCRQAQQILMDLAVQTSARIVLIGNYDLIRNSCRHNNWLRRQYWVHFRRYNAQDSEEYVSFQGALHTLLGHIPGEDQDVRMDKDFVRQLYGRTTGCVGSLKRAMSMAYKHAAYAGQKLTHDLILEFAPPNAHAAEAAREARLGEYLLMDVDFSEVEAILKDGASQSSKAAMASKDAVTKPRNGSKGPSLSRRIGERKPSRDFVGDPHA